MTESAASHAAALPLAARNGSVPPPRPAPTAPRRGLAATRTSGMLDALVSRLRIIMRRGWRRRPPAAGR
jgi:hypothetical protein